MKIHRIFEEIKDILYAAAYDDAKTNVLNILQDNWTDVTWLEEFFESNKEDLYSGFFEKISIEEAIDLTIDEADELFTALKENNGDNLSELFKPLDDREAGIKDFQEQKAKGLQRKSWLRIYAVHYYDRFVITSGAIKLTHRMKDRSHTQIELKKLEMMRDALRLNEAEDLFVYLDV